MPGGRQPCQVRSAFAGSIGREVPMRIAGGRAGPRSPSRGSGDDAQQGADRQLEAQVEPRRELLPTPRVHADFSALTALAVANEDRAARAVKVTLRESERL